MDSVIPRCPYPSVRRSNPTCGALGTMFRRQRASILLRTRGSLGRVSESESSFVRLVKSDWRKRLLRQNQNGKRVGLLGTATSSGIQKSCRATDGTHPQAFESSQVNRVSPMYPTSVVSEPQGTGKVQGVKECGKSEGRTVTVRLGPRKRRYPARKGADFQSWSCPKQIVLIARIRGEVRQCLSLNRPRNNP